MTAVLPKTLATVIRCPFPPVGRKNLFLRRWEQVFCLTRHGRSEDVGAVGLASSDNHTLCTRAAMRLAALFWLSVLAFSGHVQAAAATPCSPCHDRIFPAWAGSPHEVAGRTVKGGFRCQECHYRSLLHPTRLDPADSPGKCGRCHWTSSTSASTKPPFAPRARLGREVWTAGDHAKAGVTCLGCHSVHHYAEGGDQRLLRQAGDALCQSCHRQPKHPSYAATPDAIAKQPCISCHDPHGSRTAFLETQAGGDKGDFKRSVVHQPVAQGRCNDCHSAHIMPTFGAPPEDDEGEEADEPAPPSGSEAYKGLLLSPPRVFCYLCHGGFREKFEASGHARIVLFKQGEERSPCLGCHLPHASKYARLLRYEGNQLCLSCHPGYAPHHFLARGGVKQSELKCIKCHQPHGSGNRRLLVQAEVCKLCHKM